MSALRDLTPLMKPRSVAVIGATPDPRRPGGRPLDFLTRYGFDGPVYPVNPKYDEINGVRCFANVKEIPEPADMAVVVVPAHAVLEAVRDCQAAGIKALTIYTSGFRETGPDGAALEAAVVTQANEKGTLICGPNCQGVANLLDKMVSNFTSALANEGIDAGPIGFVSQSGLFTGIVTAELRRRGLGLGYLVSSGNEAVVDFADLLASMAEDPRIRVVAGYMEGIRDGAKLAEAAAVARRHGKPVVLLKVGRSAESAAAAASHTGAMAGAYDVYRAAMRLWGIIEVDTIQDLFDTIEAFAVTDKTARGDRIGILTNSGGLGVFGADMVRAHNLPMAQFAEQTVSAIKEKLPQFGSAVNPIDFTLQALTDPEAIGSHLRHMMRDPGVDVGLAFFGVQVLNGEALANEIARANAETEKPIVVAWMLGDPVAPPILRAAGVPCLDDPETAVKTARMLVNHGAVAAAPTRHREPANMAGAASALTTEGAGTLSEWQARAIIEAAGIETAGGVLADSAEAAAAAAEKMGFPVVLKVDSNDIAHKSEAGGVLLDLSDADAVRDGYATIISAAKAYAPDAEIRGVGVYEMVTGGVELIAGVSRDAAFGPVILVGMGGIMAEVMEDTALGVAPLSRDDADAMVRSLKGYPMLDGARGRPKCDVEAVVDVLLALSDLAVSCPQIAELDINPLMVMPLGKGVKAADALVTLSGTSS